MQAQRYIAKLLRTPPEVMEDLFSNMEKITGKKNIADKIFEENKQVVSRKLKELGIEPDKADAQFVEREILNKVKYADDAFFEFLGKPDFGDQANCSHMIEVLKNTANITSGYFIKEEKLRDFMFLNPPKNIMRELGYDNAQEMLAKENIYELFAALRFAESEKWVNRVFFRPYNDLLPEHFEERPIEIKVLPAKWAIIGEKFVGKKLHNISHLKELGFIFIIPVASKQFAGESLETFSLILHYLHEVDFYSRLIKKYSEEADFGLRVVKLLSGMIADNPEQPKKGVNWRILVRYLAKIDEHDPRLFQPHVNPETIHWLKAEREIDALSQKNPNLKLDFWRDVDDFAGEIFSAGKKGEDIVSFDLVDNVISLTHGGIGKYLYHQQEALWNKIFIEYMGEEELERIMIDSFDKGFIALR